MKLQGFNRIDWHGVKVAPGAFGGALGNAMHCNVLRRILPRVLFVAKIITHKRYNELLELIN